MKKKLKTKRSMIIGSIAVGIAAVIATLIIYFVGDEENRATSFLIAVIIPLVAHVTVITPSWVAIQKKEEE